MFRFSPWCSAGKRARSSVVPYLYKWSSSASSFSILVLFVDDTKCYKTIADITDSIQLQEDLNLLNIWSINCSMYRRYSIWVSSHNLPCLNSIGSTRTDTHKDLGIIISSNLSWKAHYNSILSKAYKIFGLLSRFHVEAKKQLYISLVYVLMLCSILWKPHLLI